jgi:hypothetical protein
MNLSMCRTPNPAAAKSRPPECHRNRFDRCDGRHARLGDLRDGPLDGFAALSAAGERRTSVDRPPVGRSTCNSGSINLDKPREPDGLLGRPLTAGAVYRAPERITAAALLDRLEAPGGA